jgi:hypothetical protein
MRKQNPDVSFDEQIRSFSLPDSVKDALLKVAKRHP